MPARWRLVRAQGCKVVSSADLVQKFEACWTAEQYESHLDAGRVIDRVTQEAFACAAARCETKAPLSEYELQHWMLEQFRAGVVITDEPPIVAVGPAHAATRTTSRGAEGSSPIRKGDLLLLDVWGKLDRRGQRLLRYHLGRVSGRHGAGEIREDFRDRGGRRAIAASPSCRNPSPQDARSRAGRWIAPRAT